MTPTAPEPTADAAGDSEPTPKSELTDGDSEAEPTADQEGSRFVWGADDNESK